IVRETPVRITITTRMDGPGLVVLTDLWDRGWRAYVDGRSVPMLRTNHALRGVVVPTGTSNVDFRYQPPTFTWGLRLSGLAAIILLSWSAFSVSNRDLAAQPTPSKIEGTDQGSARTS